VAAALKDASLASVASKEDSTLFQILRRPLWLSLFIECFGRQPTERAELSVLLSQINAEEAQLSIAQIWIGDRLQPLGDQAATQITWLARQLVARREQTFYVESLLQAG